MGDQQQQHQSMEEAMQRMWLRLEELALENQDLRSQVNERQRNESSLTSAVTAAFHQLQANAMTSTMGTRSEKLPLPDKFRGQRDPSVVLSFLYAARTYVELRFPADNNKQVSQAALLLADTALTWWRTLAGRTAIETFTDFEEAVKAEYVPANHERMVRDRLATLDQQNKTVAEYTGAFKDLMLQLPSLQDAEALDKYLRGLRPRTRREVEWKQPRTLAEAITAATLYDDIMWSRPRLTGPPTTRQFAHGAIDNHGVMPMDIDARKASFGRLSPADRDRLRATNGCFFCRKEHADHIAENCPNKRKTARARVAHLNYEEDFQ